MAGFSHTVIRRIGVKYFLENDDMHVEENRGRERTNWSEEIQKYG